MAVRDAPVKSYRGEVRAILAFTLGPCGYAGDKRAARAPNHMEKAVVSPHSADFGLIITALGAESNKLQQALKIFCANILAGNPGDFADAIRQLHFTAGREYRAAVRDKELQERYD